MEPSKAVLNVLIFVSEGGMTYWVNDNTISLEKGDVLFIPAGSVRGGERIPGRGHHRFATLFGFAGDQSDEGRSLVENTGWFKTRVHQEDYFKQRFSLLNHYSLMKGPYQDLLCHSILLEMLIIINQDHNRKQVPNKKLKLVGEIKKYIQLHYTNTITLSEIARAIERSPSYVTNLFKEVTGQSPIEYLHYVRVSKSKDLLISTSKSIREIAELTGFCDQAYYNRIFKKITGVSPTRFLTDLRVYK
jgi:AraC-like DNA-binding protein